MPQTLAERLVAFKAELLHSADPVPRKIVGLLEDLLALIDQNRGDLTEMYEAQVRVDQRLNALEKTAPTYHEPRG